MRRVHALWVLGLVFSNTSSAIFVSAVSLYLIGREVFVAKVIENMLSMTDAAALLRFFVSALTQTEFTVQALCLTLALTLVWFVRRLMHPFLRIRRFA